MVAGWSLRCCFDAVLSLCSPRGACSPALSWRRWPAGSSSARSLRRTHTSWELSLSGEATPGGPCQAVGSSTQDEVPPMTLALCVCGVPFCNPDRLGGSLSYCAPYTTASLRNTKDLRPLIQNRIFDQRHREGSGSRIQRACILFARDQKAKRQQPRPSSRSEKHRSSATQDVV